MVALCYFSWKKEQRMMPHTWGTLGSSLCYLHIPTVNILHSIHGFAVYTFHLNIIIFGSYKLILKKPYRTAWKCVDEILVTAHKMVCFGVTFTAILSKQISIKSSMSLAIPAPMKTHLSVHCSPWVDSNSFNNGAKGDGKRSQVRSWRQSSCRTNITRKQPCQMLAPLEKRPGNQKLITPGLSKNKQ